LLAARLWAIIDEQKIAYRVMLQGVPYFRGNRRPLAMRLTMKSRAIFLLLFALSAICRTPAAAAQESAADSFQDWPVISWTDFSLEADRAAWKPVDDGWSYFKAGPRDVFRLGKKESNYQPKFRSPTHIALLENPDVASFELNVRLRSTEPDYGHRDACLFFGWQSPDRYYYAHLAKAMDDRANQIFIVNEADRTKISLTTTQGTPWDDAWHWVRLRRDSETGLIQVFYDDMTTPVMTANDKTFPKGKIGVGSFDDRIDVAEVILKAK
jgi:hypothetical protein